MLLTVNRVENGQESAPWYLFKAEQADLLTAFVCMVTLSRLNSKKFIVLREQ